MRQLRRANVALGVSCRELRCIHGVRGAEALPPSLLLVPYQLVFGGCLCTCTRHAGIKGHGIQIQSCRAMHACNSKHQRFMELLAPLWPPPHSLLEYAHGAMA